MNKADLIAIRPMQEDDKNFILSTFLRGLYHGNSWFSLIPKNIFMVHYHKVATALVESPNHEKTIACLKDDPSVILGYAIHHQALDKIVLDYTFVKSSWRGIGIAKSIVPEGVSAITHLTKLGMSIWQKKAPNAVFNPFI